MKTLVTLFICLLSFLSIQSQTIHDVAVSSFAYSPQNLVINQGDIVRWTNTGGSHNVNGSTSTFPSNPEGFSNSVSSSAWVLMHTFDIPGSYDYRCDPHFTIGMTGTVEVLPAPPSCNSSSVVSGLNANTAPSGTNVSLSWDALPGADIYQAKGRRVGTSPFGQFITMNTSKNVGGLLTGTAYEWYVRARCEDLVTITPFSPFNTFMTPMPKLADQTQLEIQLFPIPADALLYLNINGAIDSYAIYDLLGRQLLESQVESDGFNSIAIDVSSLTNGVYLVEVRSNSNEKSVRKFEVNR